MLTILIIHVLLIILFTILATISFMINSMKYESHLPSILFSLSVVVLFLSFINIINKLI